jgi:hypothetical protein
MDPDSFYKMGYADGLAGNPAHASYVSEPNYFAGYEDGKADAPFKKPVGEHYTEVNKPPRGFEFTGEKRVAQPGEWYLTKNGNAARQEGTRRNEQTRHILRRI